jgi:hypothetical protein
MPYRLKRQPSGVYALFDPATGETMHPGQGPWAEANHLYVEGGRLADLLTRGPGRGEPGEVVVFDVGLGGAANALAAVTCHQGLHRSRRPVRPMRLISFEQDLEPAGLARDSADVLGYPRGFEAELDALLSAERVTLPGGLTWELRLGDFPRLVEEEPQRADLIFYDPFSPRSNEVMWSLPTLEKVYRCHRTGRPTTLITYSSAFSVRAALLLAGFYVGEGPRQDPLRRTTIACTAFHPLVEPLGPDWPARWERDREPWPHQAIPSRHKRLRQALLEHPQWSQVPSDGPERPARPRHARGSAAEGARPAASPTHREKPAPGRRPAAQGPNRRRRR